MKKFFSNFPLILVAAVVLSFFIPNLIKGKIPIPADSTLGLYHPFRDNSYDGYKAEKFPTKNPLITDPVLQTYPWRLQVVDNFKAGFAPLWNPYSFSGQPLLANTQSAPFQILNLLFFVFSFKIAWALSIILPLALTSVFMYLYLKEINLTKTAAAFGAIVLPFTGFFMAWMTWGTIVTTAMWLPLILLSFEKLHKKISPLWFLTLLISSAQTIFSGHIQTALYVFIASLAYLIFKLKKETISRAFLLSLGALVLGVLIAAPSLLPSLEFISQSARSLDQTYHGQKDWFIPIQNLIQLVAPDFFGNPATYNYWGIWNYAEFVSYIGIVPLGLAIFSVTTRAKEKSFFLALFVISLILATPNVIAKIPYSLNLPLIASLQPSRIIFLIVFSLTVLASFGLDSFLEQKSKKKLVLFGSKILILLLAIGAIVYTSPKIFPKIQNLDPRYISMRNLAIPITIALCMLAISLTKAAGVPKKLLVVLIFGITITELFRFSYKFTPFSKVELIFPRTQITDFLKIQEKPFRIMTTDRRIMHPNISGVYKIESIDGYDPLYLKNYGNYVSVLQSNNPDSQSSSYNRIVTPQNYQSPLVDLLNVKYILSFDDLDSNSLDLVMTDGSTKLYENKNFTPRAFFPEEVIKTQTPQEQYAILLQSNVKQTATSSTYSFENQATESEMKFLNYSDQNITINTQTQIDRPLVLTNVFYPGWKAYIDGQQTEVHDADAIFQLIEVPKGNHQIEFKFKPKSFYNGLYISAFALAAAVICTTTIWRKKFQ